MADENVGQFCCRYKHGSMFVMRQTEGVETIIVGDDRLDQLIKFLEH